MTPAVPDPTVEALSEAEREALLAGFIEGWAATDGLDDDEAEFLRSAPETREAAEVYADLIAPAVDRILAARAAAPDDLRDRLQALCDAAMRNKWHLGTNHVDVPVRDLLAALEETK